MCVEQLHCSNQDSNNLLRSTLTIAALSLSLHLRVSALVWGITRRSLGLILMLLPSFLIQISSARSLNCFVGLWLQSRCGLLTLGVGCGVSSDAPLSSLRSLSTAGPNDSEDLLWGE